ncbi:hypothetical protein ILYODFUR_034153 [Ilyodon furcidens]|uniref:Uncharacterized protein n=1 Tax=Ilyodon furcidens TaxID=33524 RepID=A0ABV0U045_9TELE
MHSPAAVNGEGECRHLAFLYHNYFLTKSSFKARKSTSKLHPCSQFTKSEPSLKCAPVFSEQQSSTDRPQRLQAQRAAGGVFPTNHRLTSASHCDFLLPVCSG